MTISIISKHYVNRIPAHRLILSSATEFFYTMFTTPLEDQSKEEIAIADIDGATLDAVVKCFYTGDIEISEQNIEALLAAASFLLFPYLEEKCTDFLAQPGLVNKSNCFGIWALAKSYAFDDLKEIALPYVLDNFAEVVKSDGFRQLNKSDLMELVENDEIAVDSEKVVFNAIVDWIQFDLNKRKIEFPDIIRGVRLHLLPSPVSPIHKPILNQILIDFFSQFIFKRVLSVCQQLECVDTFIALNDSMNFDKR